jgi:predicted MPP superfamily phosphohydrolase
MWPFGILGLPLVLLALFFIYCSIVYFLGIASVGRKVVLALILLLPTAAFVMSRGADDGVWRTLYYPSGIWIGVVVTLMTFFVAAWTAWGATRLVTHSPSPALYGGAALALAIFYSGYGVWNARHPRVVNINVKIRDLPPAWQGKNIVHLSDTHLGRIWGAASLERVVKTINAQKPVAVFIAGDVLDGRDSSFAKLLLPLDDITAPLGVYCAPGNHDSALASLNKTKARVLSDQMVVVDGLQIIGKSYARRGRARNVGEMITSLPGYDPQEPSILVYHAPIQTDQAKAAGINLQLSGHSHGGQIFPLQIVTRLVFGKYYYGLHVDGDYAINTTSGVGTWGPTIRTGCHPEIVVIHLESK